MTLTVIRPGMLTTVQDLGRRGYRGLGVPMSGPMDAYSHRAANLAVGNPPMAAALEITILGPELAADGDLLCAVAGAEIEILVGAVAVGVNTPFPLPSGGRIRFGARRRGARATLAVRGGFDLPPTLGSRATHLVSQMGAFGGRALRAGDALPVGALGAEGAKGAKGAGAKGATGAKGAKGADGAEGVRAIPLELPDGGARVRVLPAVHRERFTGEAWTRLTSARYVVTPQSNRMGYRLDGPALAHVAAADILSEAMPMGAIQVPASGQPILLMAECATTGGYATIANVITADLPIAGQLAPGDWIEFAPCTRDEALTALRAREAALKGAMAVPEQGQTRVRPVSDQGQSDV